MASKIQPQLFSCQQPWFALVRQPLWNAVVTTYAQRLRDAIAHSKKNQGQVAALAGTTQQVISGIISRGSRGSEYTAQIAKACGVDAYWLATGKGPMLPSSAADLSDNAVSLARAWQRLPDFKRAGYLQAVMTDAAVLEVFPELESAMRTAAIATDPDYHRLTEDLTQSRARIKRQGELDLTGGG